MKGISNGRMEYQNLRSGSGKDLDPSRIRDKPNADGKGDCEPGQGDELCGLVLEERKGRHGSNEEYGGDDNSDGVDYDLDGPFVESGVVSLLTTGLG